MTKAGHRHPGADAELRLPVLRVGLPEATGSLPLAAERLGVPVLISASSLWDAARQRFRSPGQVTWDLDMALDSAGFTVMKQWGGCYPWTVEAYVELGTREAWSWWSQPDLCCEPEIAASPKEVERRVARSAELLAEVREAAERIIRRRCLGLGERWGAGPYVRCLQASRRPMPVLQGWQPRDYVYSIRRVDEVLWGRWPALVGVGSVCRRPLHGEGGLLRLLEVLDAELPPGVRLHLFGAKGQALLHLAPFLHRIESLDSMAWDFAARRTQEQRPAETRPIDWRVQQMARWVTRQQELIDTLYRHAEADRLLGKVVATIQARLPREITNSELDYFLEGHRDQLRTVLARAVLP